MSIEDIGLADPTALSVAVGAWQAYHFLGSPEGELALAEAAVFLATAPKSNRIYRAYGAALAAAEETASAPVPKHIRNAPTREMREWGYGRGYRYDPDEPEGLARQRYLPDALAGRVFYEPGASGFEERIAERLEKWERQRAAERPSDGPDGHDRSPTV